MLTLNKQTESIMQTFETSQKMLRLVTVTLVDLGNADSCAATSIDFIPLTKSFNYESLLSDLKSYNDIDKLLRKTIPANELHVIDPVQNKHLSILGPNIYNCYGDDGMMSTLYIDANGQLYMDFDEMVVRELMRVHLDSDFTTLSHCFSEELKRECYMQLL